MTGKFYEGIRAQKPILAIVEGEIPCSELWRLNETYHYGYCYEESMQEERRIMFRQYLLDLYTEKMNNGSIDYAPNDALIQTFRYDFLSKKLENIMKDLISVNRRDK